jgi:hypothetical protein
MSRQTEALLDAFEHLPAEEKRAFTAEVLRRSLPFDSGDIEDEEIAGASSALFEVAGQRRWRLHSAVKSGSSISAWLVRLGRPW